MIWGQHDSNKFSIAWKKFGVLHWEQNFIDPQKLDSKINPDKLFEEYQIDVDFHHSNVQEDLLQVFVKIGINNIDEPKPGYRIFIEAIGIFDISQIKVLEEAQQQNLKIFATTNLMIGRIRGLIPSLTGQAPFGSYNLPSLDLNNLIEKKMESMNEKGTKE